MSSSRASSEGRTHGGSSVRPRVNADQRDRGGSAAGGAVGGGSTGDTIGGTGNVEVIEDP
nr:hypothetical protein GCM10020092_100860 [Actinoplanes digitatis]